MPVSGDPLLKGMRFGKSDLEWTADKLLKGAGAGNDPVEIDVPSFDISDKFRDFVPWVSLDAFAVGGDTGYSVAAVGPSLNLRTSATADTDAFVNGSEMYRELAESGKAVMFEFSILYLSSITNQNIWLRFTREISDPPTETHSHFGWKIIGGDLYASNGDSTNQSITDTLVDLAADYQRTRLKIVFTLGTDCKFYVNDVLKATHTTNLPTSTYYRLQLHIRTLENANKDIYISRLLIEREYS